MVGRMGGSGFLDTESEFLLQSGAEEIKYNAVEGYNVEMVVARKIFNQRMAEIVMQLIYFVKLMIWITENILTMRNQIL